MIWGEQTSGRIPKAATAHKDLGGNKRSRPKTTEMESATKHPQTGSSAWVPMSMMLLVILLGERLQGRGVPDPRAEIRPLGVLAPEEDEEWAVVGEMAGGGR